MINKHKQKQKGAETVEFAMIALLFFAILFAIIEFSRALFIWNALTEATSRGARMAIICPYQSPIPKQAAIYDVISGSLGSSPIISGLTPDMVTVRYLNQAGNNETNSTLIRFAEVRVVGYMHQLMIPLWGRSISAPEFITTLPTESLGAVPTYPGDPISPSKCDF